MKNFIIILLLSSYITYSADLLDSQRRCTWSDSGLNLDFGKDYQIFYALSEGFNGNGKETNDNVMTKFISNHSGEKVRLIFEEGTYLFTKSITMPSNFIIEGTGSPKTIFLFRQTDNTHSFIIKGKVNSLKNNFTTTAKKGDSTISVENSKEFSQNQWVRVGQNDSHLVTSKWASNSVGQVERIIEVSESTITLSTSLRIDLDLNNSPYIQMVPPIVNVGIKCIKIIRDDNTAPTHTSNIYFENAVNCYVTGVESNFCTFSHIQARYCSNLHIEGCYFHNAFGYGGDGRGYGIVLHFMTNHCLIYNNIFNHLRHSMLTQAGANANVFSYNYSINPFWESSSLPANSAGDIVLHGNYPFLNLFEQNICQNIVIDNSHGPNGPYNTFFRNRGEGYGIFFSASNSPYQNLIGNEITNKTFPYSLVNYLILGDNHFIYGNNNKGVCDPQNTKKIDIPSLYTTPDMVDENRKYFGKVGYPSKVNEYQIYAQNFSDYTSISKYICNSTNGIISMIQPQKLQVSPLPAQEILYIIPPNIITSLTKFNISIYSSDGRLVFEKEYQSNSTIEIPTKELTIGNYFITLEVNDLIFSNIISIIK